MKNLLNPAHSVEDFVPCVNSEQGDNVIAFAKTMLTNILNVKVLQTSSNMHMILKAHAAFPFYSN